MVSITGPNVRPLINFYSLSESAIQGNTVRTCVDEGAAVGGGHNRTVVVDDSTAKVKTAALDGNLKKYFYSFDIKFGENNAHQ